MIIIPGLSHLDHDLNIPQVQFVAEHFKERTGFFIESVELPVGLGTAPCGLHGPIMGDEPVEDHDVFEMSRGGRPYTSRLTPRPFRRTRTITVVAGPHGDDECVMYTAYAGPPAHREPGDESLSDDERRESEAFWAHHALSASTEELARAHRLEIAMLDKPAS